MPKYENKFIIGLKKTDEKKPQYIELYATGPRAAKKKIINKLNIEGTIGLFEITSIRKENIQQVVMDFDT